MVGLTPTLDEFSATDLRTIDPAPGEALVVRSAEGYIAAGEIGNANDSFEPGDWLVNIPDPVVWDVSNRTAERVKLDYGPTIDYRYDDGPPGGPDDWAGPSLSIGVGDGQRGGTEQVPVLRIPDPVFDSKGVRYYFPQDVGDVVRVSTGQLVDLSMLLDEEEEPPRTTEVKR